MATTTIGAVTLTVAYRLKSPSLIQFCMAIIAGIILLDGLPYIMFNALWPREPGDYGRILDLWRSRGLPGPALIHWTLVAVGAAGSLAAIYLPLRLIYKSLREHLALRAGVPEPRRLSSSALVGFLILPSLALCYMFDWNQLIHQVGTAPNHVSLAMAGVCIALLHLFPPHCQPRNTQDTSR